MIRLEELEVSINKSEIIKGVSFHVNKGDFVGLIGPNGSGKSTILKTIYKLIDKKCGAIYINGKEIDSISIKSMARELAVVSQFNQYNFSFKVKDIVLMGRNPYKRTFQLDNKEDYDIVREALEKVNMLEYKDRDFLNLSGGEKQRVLLARALAQKTEILLLDEPTNHLDIKYQIEIMNIVKALNITVLAALHDMNLVSAYCNKVYMIDKGKVVYGGETKEVLTPKNIKDVFGVECEIGENSKGHITINFLF
ncbi:ABC transporter ATP-binding protein [Clostridium perfringens]